MNSQEIEPILSTSAVFRKSEVARDGDQSARGLDSGFTPAASSLQDTSEPAAASCSEFIIRKALDTQMRKIAMTVQSTPPHTLLLYWTLVKDGVLPRCFEE